MTCCSVNPLHRPPLVWQRVAMRTGGHFATGPTHIDDLVESVTVVSPMGTTTTRRLPGNCCTCHMCD